MPTSRLRQIRPISGGCYGYPIYLGFDGPPEPVRNLAGGLTGLWWLLIIAALICFGACEYMRRKSVTRRERQEKNRLGAAFSSTAASWEWSSASSA